MEGSDSDPTTMCGVLNRGDFANLLHVIVAELNQKSESFAKKYGTAFDHRWLVLHIETRRQPTLLGPLRALFFFALPQHKGDERGAMRDMEIGEGELWEWDSKIS